MGGLPPECSLFSLFAYYSPYLMLGGSIGRPEADLTDNYWPLSFAFGAVTTIYYGSTFSGSFVNSFLGYDMPSNRLSLKFLKAIRTTVMLSRVRRSKAFFMTYYTPWPACLCTVFAILQF